jgi:integral membrane protein (TIGR01906 family)
MEGLANASQAAKLDNDPASSENSGVAAAGRQRGTHMGFARMLATIVFVVALPVAIVTTNIRILVNVPLVYDYAFDRYNAEETTGLSRTDLNATAKGLRDYFNNGEPTFYGTVTEGGLQGPVFNARETQHLHDVKHVFVWMNRVQAVSLVFVLAYAVVFFVWLREGSVRDLAMQSLVGLGLGVLAVGGVAIFAAFGFEAAWSRFHELLFSNDLWQLDPQTDHLIQMFPEKFWRDMTVLLGLMCAVEAALIGAAAGIYLLGTRHDRRVLPAALEMNASNTQAA